MALRLIIHSPLGVGQPPATHRSDHHPAQAEPGPFQGYLLDTLPLSCLDRSCPPSRERVKPVGNRRSGGGGDGVVHRPPPDALGAPTSHSKTSQGDIFALLKGDILALG